MNKYARMVLLSGALAITIASACAAAYGAEFNGAPDADVPVALIGEKLSLSVLEGRLRETHAIPLLKKMALKSEIGRLMASLRLAHEGGAAEVGELRQPYDQLLTRVRSLLTRDPQLASDIAASREAIWNVLADRTKFASSG